MKINANDKEKVMSATTKIEGKSEARTLDYTHVDRAIAQAEKQLTVMQIPKKYWTGSAVYISPPAVPNSYRWLAEGTGATLTRFQSGWFVTHITRDRCESRAYGGGRRYDLMLSDLTKDHIPNPINVTDID